MATITNDIFLTHEILLAMHNVEGKFALRLRTDVKRNWTIQLKFCLVIRQFRIILISLQDIWNKCLTHYMQLNLLNSPLSLNWGQPKDVVFIVSEKC